MKSIMESLSKESAAEELKQIGTMKRLISAPAYVWERHTNGECSGNCKHPKVVAISVSGTIHLTCCEFYPAFERLQTLELTERMLRQKLWSEEARERRRSA